MENDQAHRECLREMSAVLRVYNLRKLFAKLLLLCKVDSSLRL